MVVVIWLDDGGNTDRGNGNGDEVVVVVYKLYSYSDIAK